MKVTRDVILDLLPLYLGDEVSADTRMLVEQYLETDSQLAQLVKQSKPMVLSNEIPVPLTKENQMETYKEAKKLMLWRTAIIAGFLALVLFVVLVLALGAAFFLTVGG